MNLWRVAKLATAIRLLHLLLLLLLDQALPDYDTSVSLHPPDGPSLHSHPPQPTLDDPHPASQGNSSGKQFWHSRLTPFSGHDTTSAVQPNLTTLLSPFQALMQALGSLTVWDSVFFARIARHGYEHEQYYAFFPLHPYLISRLGHAWVSPSAFALSLLCSVATAVLFAALSAQVLRDPAQAAVATLLLCLGQASVFYTVAYTESLFSALTMAGLCCLYCTHVGAGSGTGILEADPGCVLGRSGGLPQGEGRTASAASAAAKPAAIEATKADAALTASAAAADVPKAAAQHRPEAQADHPAPALMREAVLAAAPWPLQRWRLLRLTGACLAFTVASCTRSNGTINAGYLAHYAAETAIERWQSGSRVEAAAQLAAGALAAAAVAAPLAAFQLHGYVTFCCPGLAGQGVGGDLGFAAGVWQPVRSALAGQGLCPTASKNSGTATGDKSGGTSTFPGRVVGSITRSLSGEMQLPDTSVIGGTSGATCSTQAVPSADSCSEGSTDAEGHGRGQYSAKRPIRPWCTAWPPSIYSFVQQHYWDVGFLRYWRPEQLPNFLLASPALLLAGCGVCAYAHTNLPLLLRGGWQALLPAPTGSSPRYSQNPAQNPAASQGFLSPGTAVHIYPWAFMALCALLVMHVQVATRFLSCCPAHYWFMAHLTAGSACNLERDVKGVVTCSGHLSEGGRKGDVGEGEPGRCGVGQQKGGGAAVQGGEYGECEEEGMSSRQAEHCGTKLPHLSGQQQGQRGWRQVQLLLLWGCCLGYTVVGSVMLPNFYPWT